MAREDRVVRWLLAGDPAVVYGTRRLLLGEARPPRPVTGQVATLLARRAADGTWGGGLYSPKWISTHYTLLELVGLGVDPREPACRASARRLLDAGFTDDGGIALWESRRSDDCVTAMVLAMLAYFRIGDPRVARLVDGLLAAELAGGGWNCRRRQHPRCASVHTTLSVLEAFDELARRGVDHRAGEVAAASARGREVLLARRLYQRRASGRPLDAQVTTFRFPPRWRFDVLRCLVAFARAGVPYDERMRPALELVRARRGEDGTWKATTAHRGRLQVAYERAGRPGRWNTLRARYVLARYPDVS